MNLMDIHPKTADINKTQKNISKKSRQEVLVWLANTFPKAFNVESKVQPLKIGIINDIFAYTDKLNVPYSKSKIREALVIFTRRMDYLASLKTRNMRVDLDGNTIAQVTEQEAENASLKIKQSIDKNIKKNRKPQESFYAGRASGIKNQALITLKKRSPKSFDPHAIARLKEKLGLKREEVEVEEELTS